MQVRIRQICLKKPGPPEIRIREIGFCQIGMTEISTKQICL
jgi:hypothetical protein